MTKEELLQIISSNITDNNSGDITAEKLRVVLNSMVEYTPEMENVSLDGYLYISNATPSTTPITLTGDEKVFYIATEEGDYANYGLRTISELSVIKSENGSWIVEGLGVPFNAAIVKKEYVTSVNLFDQNNPLNGPGYWKNSNLLLEDSTFYKHSHPIPVKAGVAYLMLCHTDYDTNTSAPYVDKNNHVLKSFYGTIISNEGDNNKYIRYLPMEDGYISINYTTGNEAILMFCEEDKYPDTYTPYYQYCKIEEGIDLSDFQKEKVQPLIEAYIDDKVPSLINVSISSKANLVEEIGKNLFDKAQIISGKYINDTSGALQSNVNAAVSSPIEITPNQVYYLYRGGLSLGAYACRFIDVDGNPLLPLKEDGSEYAKYGSVKVNSVIKAPANAKYIQFVVKWSSISAIDVTQLEKGNVFTGYEPYQQKKVLSYDELPSFLLKEESSVNANNFIDINIENSDKIGIFSTSFMQGYAMRNHHHLNHLSMFLDYIIYNYGVSGDDELENLAKLEQDAEWLGDVPPSKWNITYGVVMHQENSGALLAANSETAYQNAKKLANAIKSLGGIPIFSTEHDQSYAYYQAAIRLCNEEGYMFMHWGRSAYLNAIRQGIFKPMWNSMHPATRTGWIITLGMLPYLQSLPRPKKGVKLFRVRDGVDTSDLNNLIYDDYYSRAKRFVELTCGVSALTADTEKYFDRLDAGGDHATVKDEYQKIQNKGSVNFGNYALAHIITPYTKTSIKSAKLFYVSTGVSKVYIKKNLTISNPLSEKRYYSFGIIDGADKLTAGSTFTISGITRADGVSLNREWTIKGVVGNMLITTTTSSPSQGWQNAKTSGVDEPIISISGVTLKGSYDYPSDEYLNNYTKPKGEWIDITDIDDITDYLEHCMDYDTISILFEGSNIAISDINLRVTGTIEKNTISIPITEYQQGESLISDTLFDNSTSWRDISDIPNFDNMSVKSTITDSYEPLPIGVNIVKEFHKGNVTYQTINSSLLVNDSPMPIKVQVRVLARYFPEFIDSDDKWSNSEITEQSFDVARLAISIGKTDSDLNPMKIAELSIGCYWHQYIVNTYLTTASYVKIECTDKKVQIGRFELVKL